jgi:glycosyltransferase involved in cell wall biosynthesis
MSSTAISYLDSLIGHKLVVVMPAFNEESTIGSVVLKTRRYADTIIVVDDGSNDATAEIATDAGAVVVCHDRNLGKGQALNTGFRKARELGADIVVTIDADGQHLPEELDGVLAPVLMESADLVVGSRYLTEANGVPRHRKWGHKVFNLITGWTSGTLTTDSQSGFRAFSRAALETVSFSSSGFSVESEMQFLAREHKLRILEAPVTIRYDQKPKRPVVNHGLMVLNGILRLVGQYRPLMFFGLPGMLMMITGVALGIWIVDIYARTQNLAMGYALISVLLFMMGSISLSTGVILHSVRGLILDLVGRGQE